MHKQDSQTQFTLAVALNHHVEYIVFQTDKVVLYAKKNNNELLFKSIPKSLIDSIYVTYPSRFSEEKESAKVGSNLIASGVFTFVSAISIFVGVQLEQLEEAAFVAGISSVISTASLINAGVVSNAQEPPPTHLKHIIVF